MTPLRAAVVGAGTVGSVHARALAAHPAAELVAVCGRTSPRAERLAAAYGVRAYLAVDEMMRTERPDVVCVCTGNKDHPAPTLAALAGGAHVFVEKPLAFSLDEARAMVEAARERGVKLGVNFNHRFSAPYRRALAFVGDESLGPPAYLTLKFAGSLYEELNDPYCQLIETQGHSFDLLRLFGGEITEVSAFLGDPRGIGVYTSAAVALRFESGAVGTLVGSWDSSYAHPEAQLFEYCAVGGRAVVENVVDAVRLFRHDREEYTEWRPGLFETAQRDFWHTIDTHLGAFLDAVAGGREPPVTGEDGLRALELTFAAVRSFEERRPVPALVGGKSQ